MSAAAWYFDVIEHSDGSHKYEGPALRTGPEQLVLQGATTFGPYASCDDAYAALGAEVYDREGGQR